MSVLPLEVEEFLTWLAVERGRSQNTLASYRRDLGAYCGWLAERSEEVLSVTPAVVEQYVVQRRASGRAAASVARELAALRMMHRFLVDERFRADDPTADLEGVRVPTWLPKPLTEDETVRLNDRGSSG